MGSHHHHQHHYQNHQPTNYCCCCSCTSSHPSPLSHSQPQITDSLLLQAIANHLLQPSQTHLYPQHLKPQQQQKHQHQQQQQQLYNQHQQTQSLITSLHNRINTLESSLLHLSTSKPSPPPPPPPPLSLRDIAARTIQTHFRTLLVRRSRTLRHLKDLAFIKSCLNGLKSSLSENTHINCEALSQKAMDLLLKLDSIQGSDSMIRDGKRSISRELVRFVEFVDEVSVRRRDTYSKATKNLREKLSDQVQEIQGYVRVSEDDEESHVELEGFHHIDEDDEEIPINLNYGKNEISQAKNGILVKRQFLHPKAKKNVRFAENGKISGVFVSTHEPFSNRDIGIDDPRVSSEDQRELVEHLCREVEEIGGFSRGSEDDEEEAHEEKRGPPPQLSDGGRNPRKNIKTHVNYGIGEHFQGQNGNFVFSAPEPVKMEPRQDDLKRKKTVRMTSF